jgi:purine-binding chemotaxis protein CheW
MRPLPIEPVAGAPDFVLGLAIIRGAPIPVLDLLVVLAGGRRDRPIRQLVTLRLADRQVALAVDRVMGVETLDATILSDLPPLLRCSDPGVVESIGASDGELLVLLRTGRLIETTVEDAL